MGERGRLVVPIELRERLHLEAGSPILLLDTPAGVILMTREQAKAHMRQALSGLDLVAELLVERRSRATTEDAA